MRFVQDVDGCCYHLISENMQDIFHPVSFHPLEVFNHKFKPRLQVLEDIEDSCGEVLEKLGFSKVLQQQQR